MTNPNPDPIRPEDIAGDLVDQFAEFVMTHPDHELARGIEVTIDDHGQYAFRYNPLI